MGVSFFSGDSQEYDFAVVDTNNVPVPITGANIEWVIAVQGTEVPVLSKTVGEGITITNATGGLFTVVLAISDTLGLAGVYQEALRLTTTDGKSAIISSRVITVTKGLI